MNRRTFKKQTKKGNEQMEFLVKTKTREGKLKYEWKTADTARPEWNSGVYYSIDGNAYYENKVYKVKNNFNDKYVRCKLCGKVIENSPEKIEEHYKEIEKNIDCLNCSQLRLVSSKDKKITHEKQEDGTYKRLEESIVQYSCWSDNYNTSLDFLTDVENIEYTSCKYLKHRKMGVEPFSKNMLNKYPKAFETLITEEKLIENGWELCGISRERKEYRKFLKKAGFHIYANCDIQGVVEDFCECSTCFIYMPYYEKYVECCGYTYNTEEDHPIEKFLADQTKEEIKKLYK